MRWSLKFHQTSGSATSDFTIYAFQTGFRPFDSIFTDEESQVIARVLRFMRDQSGGNADESAADQALISYWQKFLPESQVRLAGD